VLAVSSVCRAVAHRRSSLSYNVHIRTPHTRLPNPTNPTLTRPGRIRKHLDDTKGPLTRERKRCAREAVKSRKRQYDAAKGEDA
jgi:hypothetical protein